MRRRITQAALVVANRLLAATPVRIETARRLAYLQRMERRLSWLDSLPARYPNPNVLPRAQLGQDLFVLNATSFQTGGFFVEFGAGDGLNLSNTVLLEQAFGWKGIVAEPAKSHHPNLFRNRSCIIDTRCVWSTSGERLDFSETREAEYSTVSDLVERHSVHEEQRSPTAHFRVDTVSLDDLLDEHSAPDRIDYLSVDTEGSEYEILGTFDFSRREIGIITVEHNFDTNRRSQLHELLSAHGFRRVLEEMSVWDDWYVNESVPLSAEVLIQVGFPGERGRADHR